MQSRSDGGVGSGLKKEKRERERERERRIGYIFSLFRLPMAPVSDTARHGHSWNTHEHGAGASFVAIGSKLLKGCRQLLHQ